MDTNNHRHDRATITSKHSIVMVFISIGALILTYALTTDAMLNRTLMTGESSHAVKSVLQVKHQLKPKTKEDIDTELLHFLPKRKKLIYCDRMFSDMETAISIPLYYQTLSNMVDYHTRTHGGLKTGHIGNKRQQIITYLRIVKSSFIRTVCETGFNDGHSALLWLAGNPNVSVYSFDMGHFAYSKSNANLLSAAFPSRFKVIWGDSKQTVPCFTQRYPQVKCDIIFIDGGHSFETVQADLRNLRLHANPKYNLVSIDDYNLRDTAPTQAWKNELKIGQIKEHFTCTSSIRIRRQRKWGFTLGRYINITKPEINLKPGAQKEKVRNA